MSWDEMYIMKLARYNARQEDMEERKLIIGGTPRTGKPVLGEVCSFGIGGQPKMGKSSIAAHLAWSAVVAGGTLAVVDPHMNSKNRGLLTKLLPLSPWFAIPLTDFKDINAVVGRFLWMEQEHIRRENEKELTPEDRPVWLIVDEFNLFLSRLDDDQVKDVCRVIANVARGGAKFGMFIILIAHNWQLAQIGDGPVRKNLTARIAGPSEPSDYRMTLGLNNTRQINELTTPLLRVGDAIVKHPMHGCFRAVFPSTDARDTQAIAFLLHDSGIFPPVAVRSTIRPALTLLPSVTTSSRSFEQPKASVASCPAEECGSPVPGTADEVKAAYEPNRGAKIREEVRQLPEDEPQIRFVGVSEPAEPAELGNQRNRYGSRKKVTQETLDEIICLRMQGESHNKIREVVKLQGRAYQHLYIPACQHLGLELNQNAPMNAREWMLMKQYYNWTCLACGRKEPEITLEPDHIIPRSKDGSDSITNRQPLCKPCNASKKDRTVDYRKQQTSETATIIESTRGGWL